MRGIEIRRTEGCGLFAQEDAERNEIQVRHAVLEPARDEGADRENNGENLVGHRAPRQGQPLGEQPWRRGKRAGLHDQHF